MGAILFSIDPNLLQELTRLLPLRLFVETGTYQGDSLAIAERFFARCLSIESSPELHQAATARFAGDPRIQILHGNSPAVLAEQRALFQPEPTLFWLDAHWCGDATTSGREADCPLLAEIAAISALNPESVLMIDDARLFLAPPPPPHNISGWPKLDEILLALRRLSNRHAVAYFNDVILYLPSEKLSALQPYLHRHGFDLLAYAHKASHYDSLLESAKGKEIELGNITKIAQQREQYLIESNQEADRLRNDLIKLMAEVQGHRDAEAERARRAEEVKAHAAAVDQLTSDLKAKDAALDRAAGDLAAKEADVLRLSRELEASQAEGDRLRKEANERLRLIETNESKHAQLAVDLAAAHAGLTAKESVIQELKQICDERLNLINRLAFTGEKPVVNATKVVTYRMRGPWERFTRTLRKRFHAWLEHQTPYEIGKLVQHPPRPLKREKFPSGRAPAEWPRICIITPSYNQAAFLARTMDSVLDQRYPRLAYGVQDGGSTDGSTRIIEERIDRLTHSESVRDEGQADAIQKGLTRLYPGPKDIMAWLNSDDMLLPGTLEYVGRYFAEHPEVDVIYGHRVIIDEEDREVGRWYMPPHHADTLPWFDLVPQETLFWRASCFMEIGGMDPSFHFAMDWDLLLRFEQAGFHIQRVPYFLGCFRVHSTQKTSTRIQTLGETEMTRLRQRTHQRDITSWEIYRQLNAEVGRSYWVAWMHKLGLRR